MFKFLTRKIFIPSDDTTELETVDMWVVSWYARYGEYSGETHPCYQSFFSQEDAYALANALMNANKLIGNTSGTKVNVEKQRNCKIS